MLVVPSISYLTTLRRWHRLRGRAVRAFLIVTLSGFGWAQSGGSASVQGTVRDGQGRVVAQCEVRLQAKDSGQRWTATSDAKGSYKFEQLRDGVYVLRVVSAGGTAEIPSIALGADEIRTVDVRLGSAASSGQSAPQFYDEPQFTVSGVTDTTNLGGHGSDTVVRTRESLAKETQNLARTNGSGPTHSETEAGGNAAGTEKSLREALAHEPASAEANQRLGALLLASGRAEEAIPYLRRAAEIQPEDAEVHHALGDAEEKRGDPLEAVRQYQRAAELDASEAYLFDWGAELLLHHAPEPAIEVFTKGNARYPTSARMLIGLGAAAFARGANDEAVQRICEASELNPVDPTPYLFLGKMLHAGNKPSQQEIEKLQRFANLRPQSAEANYYYAVALWKSRKDANDPRITQAESLLARTVQLNRKFAAAYLQLGIMHAEERDYGKAIAEYEQAVQIDPRLEEAHFRLGQAYRQAGEVEKSKEELRIHRQLAQESAQQIDRERHEIRQFVYTLRDKPGQGR
ncbi:MAG TPA: tetratricopeptide repeat protein [Candidatus Sulfotelmatobacter sp.]